MCSAVKGQKNLAEMTQGSECQAFDPFLLLLNNEELKCKATQGPFDVKLLTGLNDVRKLGCLSTSSESRFLNNTGVLN